MPYVPRLKYVNFTFATAILSNVTVDTVAGNSALGSIVLPSLSGTIVGITAEFRIATIEDSSAGPNFLNGVQKIQMDVDSGGYDDVVDMTGTLNLLANAVNYGCDVQGSYIPVSSLTAGLTWGQTCTFRWEDAKSSDNDLYCYDIQVILHVLVRF